MSRSIRLQGESWYNYRRQHKLTLTGIYKSSHGNYRADLIDENNKKFHHWLHPIEAERLEQSGYLKEHPAEESDLLFPKQDV